MNSAIKSRLDLLDLATNGHLAMMTKAKMKKFSPPNLNLSAPSALTRMHPVGTGEHSAGQGGGRGQGGEGGQVDAYSSFF